MKKRILTGKKRGKATMQPVVLAAVTQDRFSEAMKIGGPFAVFGSLDGETLAELSVVPKPVPVFLYQCD